MPSTREFLSDMDMDQLVFVRDEAQRRITAIQDEEKVLLWCVSDRNYRYHCCKDYLEAVEKLVKVANKLVGTDVSCRTLCLEPLRVHSSEVSNYLDIVDA